MPLRSLALFGTLCVLGSTASAQYTPSAGRSAPTVKMKRELVDKDGNHRVEEYEVKATADHWGNAQGNQHDLAVDGAFAGQTVAVLHFYIGESFDFSLPKAALAEKGFATYRWIGKPPSPEELETSLAKASQLWLISSEANLLTPKHVAVIKKFFDAGHGVYIRNNAYSCGQHGHPSHVSFENRMSRDRAGVPRRRKRPRSIGRTLQPELRDGGSRRAGLLPGGDAQSEGSRRAQGAPCSGLSSCVLLESVPQGRCRGLLFSRPQTHGGRYRRPGSSVRDSFVRDALRAKPRRGLLSGSGGTLDSKWRF